MAKVLYKINRKQTGEPTAEEKWHEGFCLECVFNPYNMEDE
jgi:hypothetical protein